MLLRYFVMKKKNRQHKKEHKKLTKNCSKLRSIHVNLTLQIQKQVGIQCRTNVVPIMPLSQHQLDAVPDAVGPHGAREGGGALSEKFSLQYYFNSVDVAYNFSICFKKSNC